MDNSGAPKAARPRKAERLIRELIRIQAKSPENWPTLSLYQGADDSDLEVMGQYGWEAHPSSLSIAFVLDEKGRFLGISNWKQ